MREIRYEFSDIYSQTLRLSSFDLVKIVNFLRITLCICNMFYDSLLVQCTYSKSSLPSKIFPTSLLPVATLTGIVRILTILFMIFD